MVDAMREALDALMGGDRWVPSLWHCGAAVVAVATGGVVACLVYVKDVCMLMRAGTRHQRSRTSQSASITPLLRTVTGALLHRVWCPANVVHNYQYFVLVN